MKMLDLSTYKEEYLQIKVNDDTALNVRKPTQRMLLAVMNHQETLKSNDAREIMASMRQLVLDILNSNKERIVISTEDVDTMPLELQNAVIAAYIAFINSVRENPNS